jgi:hypothetical protein
VRERPDLAGPPRRHRGDGVYYAASAAILAFGVLGILSIGLPFVVIGALMLGLGHARDRPEVFWPPIVGVVAWTIAMAVAFPASCEVSVIGSSGSTATSRVESCRSLVGALEIPGLVAVIAATAIGLASAFSLRAWTMRRRRRAEPPS